jgi:hypothetical protein
MLENVFQSKIVEEAYSSHINNDEFFRKYDKSSVHIRAVEWKNGILYSSPGNTVGIILSKEFDSSMWKTSLMWKDEKEKDISVYKKCQDEKYWCIQNDYMKQISDLIGKKELTVKFNSHEQLAVIEYGRWIFVIAPTYIKEQELKFFQIIELKEMNNKTLSDLW